MTRYYNIEQVAKITGMSASTIYHHTMACQNRRRQLLPEPCQRRPMLLWKKHAIDEWQKKAAQAEHERDISTGKKVVPKKEHAPVFDNAAAAAFLTTMQPARPIPNRPAEPRRNLRVSP